MTNEEILKAAKATLFSLDRQRRFILEIFVGAKDACPSCGDSQSPFEASGFQSVNDYDLGHGDEPPYHCRSCKRPLMYVVPFIGPFFMWRIDFEREKKEKESAEVRGGD